MKSPMPAMETRSGPPARYRVAWVLCGLLLLAVAATPSSVRLVAEVDHLLPRPAPAALRILSCAIGLWLIIGLSRRVSWLMALLLAEVLTGVFLYGGLATGAASGQTANSTTAWILGIALATVLVILLVLFRPDLNTASQPKAPWVRVGSVALVLTATIAIAAVAPPRLPAVAPPNAQPPRILPPPVATYALLDPEKWPGKPFTLMDDLDNNARKQISRGRWIAVLYHFDCPFCEEEMPLYEKAATALAVRPDAPRIAFIEMKPYPPEKWRSPNSPCLFGRLSDAKDWILTAPTVVELSDGGVVSAHEGCTYSEVAGLWEPAKPKTATGDPETDTPYEVPTSDKGPKGHTPQFNWEAEKSSSRQAATDHDFGFVEPQSKHQVVFQVNNPTGAVLRIRKVSSECRCMGVVDPPKEIAPGGTAEVKAVLVAPKKSLIYDKRLFLVPEGEKATPIALRIKAKVGLPLEVLPPVVDAGSLKRGEKRECQITIRNSGLRDVRPVYAVSSDPACVARIPNATVPAGGELAISILVRGDGTSTGPRTVRITVHTDVDTQSCLDASVRFTLLDD